MKISKYCLFFLCFILLSCLNNEQASSQHQQNNIVGKVVHVKDGDSFVLLVDGKEEVVRLAYIDCPEKGQAYGNAAKRKTIDLCAGKKVKVVWDGNRDRYKRVVGVVWVDDTVEVNKVLLDVGLAWHYTYHSNDKIYAAAEQQARDKRIGLWQEPNPVAPWDYRKQKRKKQPTTEKSNSR